MAYANRLHPQYIVDPQGQKIAVLLPIKEYETLLEDLCDLAAVAERRDEAVAMHAGVFARLKADGFL